MADDDRQRAVADLPFAQGHVFSSLDEYLEFRKLRGTSDVPWYRRIAPGQYELITRRPPGAQPRIYTREQLARKFGFEN